MKNEMGRASSTHGRDEKYLEYLVGEPGRKRSLGKPGSICKDNIKWMFERNRVRQCGLDASVSG